MADKEMFSYWVTQPELLQKSDIDKLIQWKEQYPYFQLAHVLLAKAVSIGEPNDLHRYIPKASIYAYNRRALQMLVENDMEWSVDLLNRLTRTPQTKIEGPIMEDNAPESTPEADSFIPYEPTTLVEFTLENSLGTLPEEDGTHAPTPVQEIIQRFIKTDPTIRSRPPELSATDEIEDFSSRSEISIEDLATESFAEILAKQGKKEKAIGIYEKLILKMPEKKDYFAKKIEMLS